MSVPNLSELKHINDLLAKLNELKLKREQKHDMLGALDKKYQLEKQVLKTKLVADEKQRQTLLAIQDEINSVRRSEEVLRSELEKTISESVNTFLSSGKINLFISKLIDFLLNSVDSVTVEAGPDMMSILPADKKLEIIQASKGVLRIKSGVKTYILDHQLLARELSQKALISVLTS